MATFTRDQLSAGLRRGANGRFASAAATVRKTTSGGSHAASRPPLPPR